MKVRATQEGVYGGYLRTEGEIFEIDDKPFELKDGDGKPVIEKDENGKPKLGPGGKPKVKMTTWFAPNWMEKVSDDEEVTNDYPPFQLPVQYREVKKKKTAPPTLVMPPTETVI